MFSGPDKDELLIVRALAAGCSIGFQESTFKPFIIIKFVETWSVDVNKVITDTSISPDKSSSELNAVSRTSEFISLNTSPPHLAID